MSDSIPPIVAYGSSRGGSERVAKSIAQSIGVTAIQLNHLDFAQLGQAEFAIFVISTIGNGSYPKNAERFCQEFENIEINLSKLRFALLALGSSIYTYFCRAGESLYKMLTERGAEPFVPFARSDKAAQDLGVGVIDKFVRDSTSKLAKEKKENAIQFTVIPSESVDLPPNKFQRVQIVQKELLSAPGYSPRLTKFRIPVPSGVTYKAGGLVNILPENDPEIVSQVLTKFNIDPSTTFSVHDPLDTTPIPLKVTANVLFLKYLDLSAKVPVRLAAYGQVESPVSKSIGRFLVDEFNGTVANVTDLLSVLPQIEPRTYSIASEKSDVCELIIADVFIEPDRLGLSTGYLGRPTTTEVAVQFIEGDFVYPEVPETPLLLIALGSGIAPLISILEHRKTGKFGKCFLIYGLRVREAALNVIESLNQYKAEGIVDEFWLAISRAEDHLHVQDVLLANAGKVWELWSDRKTELFYCGLPAGYDSVKDTLIKISIEQGKQTRNAAISSTSRHKITVESY